MSSFNISQVMGPGDNDMSFQTDVFNGDNFSCWKFRITHVFKAAGLWEIVSGKETWDLDSKDFDGRKAFNRRSSKAFSILSAAVSAHVLIGFQDCEDVAAAWQRLCETNEQKAAVNRLHLRRQFFTAEMAAGSTMMEFITK